MTVSFHKALANERIRGWEALTPAGYEMVDFDVVVDLVGISVRTAAALACTLPARDCSCYWPGRLVKPIWLLLELDDSDKLSGARSLKESMIGLGRTASRRLRGLGSFLSHFSRPRGAGAGLGTGVGSGWLSSASLVSFSDDSYSWGGRIGVCVK